MVVVVVAVVVVVMVAVVVVVAVVVLVLVLVMVVAVVRKNHKAHSARMKGIFLKRKSNHSNVLTEKYTDNLDT